MALFITCKHIIFMKISIYTTLLIAFIFAAQPGLSQNKKYKDFYKSVNKAHHNAKMIKSGSPEKSDVILEEITALELDSLMKNMVGVTDIMVGGKSILHPVVTLELDPVSPASEALFGSVETLDRTPMVGRAALEPKISGIATVRRKSDVAPKTDVAVAETVAPETTSNKKEDVTSKFSAFQNEDWKLFRAVDVTLINQTDKGFFKKFSIVLGTFKSLNNADFIKRTFNSMGEHSIVVKNTVGGYYYALVGGYDTEAEAVQAMENITKKYTEGISKTRRISRFGIPLDDMWILITK